MNNEVLKKYAWEVEQILKVYVTIKDSLFKETGTFFSVVKNLFRKVNYEAYYKDTAFVFQKSLTTLGKLESFKEDSYTGLNTSQKKFCDTLLEYHQALIKTIKSFLKITYELHQTSKSFRNRKLNYPTFQKDMKVYNEAIDEYQRIGLKLMELYEEFDRPTKD